MIVVERGESKNKYRFGRGYKWGVGVGKFCPRKSGGCLPIYEEAKKHDILGYI